MLTSTRMVEGCDQTKNAPVLNHLGLPLAKLRYFKPASLKGCDISKASEDPDLLAVTRSSSTKYPDPTELALQNSTVVGVVFGTIQPTGTPSFSNGQVQLQFCSSWTPLPCTNAGAVDIVVQTIRFPVRARRQRNCVVKIVEIRGVRYHLRAQDTSELGFRTIGLSLV